MIGILLSTEEDTESKIELDELERGQEKKKESVLGAIKKYQAEDKEKPKEKKEARKEAER